MRYQVETPFVFSLSGVDVNIYECKETTYIFGDYNIIFQFVCNIINIFFDNGYLTANRVKQ